MGPGQALDDPQNEPLTRALVPIFVCPADISATGRGDLSYAVNGGIGYTNKHANGTRDVPVDGENRSLDLNGDGVFPHDAVQPTTSPTDRELFKRMGLFFMETWKHSDYKASSRPGGRSRWDLANDHDGRERPRWGRSGLCPREFRQSDPPAVRSTCRTRVEIRPADRDMWTMLHRIPETTGSTME